MIKAQFTYSDGKQIIREFKDEKEMQWFAFNEGDHLLDYKQVILAEMNPDKSNLLVD